MANLQSQKEKIEETYHREYASLINRQNDLNKQLCAMQEKFKV
jgi:flagellar capping protein FliD